ncbi:MAG TPA: transferrin receptor-like dimerization domain-containing protein [Rhizomicrobium sp.]|nr:transferrin receptor-like dimerization domain-containing protein [Rhizomicrobium sp.]
MIRIVSLAAVSVLALGVTAYAENMPAPADPAALQKSFDANINPSELSDWMKLMASEPNHVGSPHDKLNAEWELQKFKDFGWDAHIETFQVLYPTPIAETVELLGGKKPFKATLQEKAVPGDTTARAKEYALPAYLAYQGDGDVTAPIVYVNYGMQDDYKQLERMGVSVKGKIVLARYGAGWRGLKPLLAQQHGAIGCLIYSDPADDGYATGAPYPEGPARPPQGIQRGSVQDMTLYPGDPLTPGVGATADAKRLTREEATTILKIPALPISYADATVLMKTLTGRVVPGNWRGALPITYRVGPSAQDVHLMVKSDWSLKTIYDVVAMMKGSEYPDQWVVRGNHHDGWVYGASDPLSGQVALLAEAKSFGELAKTGWRPKRTLVYLSWDGEEPGLLGSTEWAETHAAELKKKAIIYINSDGNGRGFWRAEGSHDLQHFVNEVTDGLTDPETHVSVSERSRAAVRAQAMSPTAREDIKAEAKIDADPKKDYEMGPLGSGSDYSVYIEHLGLPALNVGYGGEGDGGGGDYHSRYDTWEHHSRFDDPGFVYDAMLAHTVGHMVLQLADTDLPVVQAGDFADTVAMYLGEVKKLADTRREAAEVQAKAIADHVFQDTYDPTKTNGEPTALKPVPKFDFKPMDDAVKTLQASAKAYDDAFAANGSKLSADQRAALWAAIQPLDQTLAPDNVGLPGRPWFRNLVYAPGRYTGYGAKTLPGIREAIEDERFDDATRYITLTANALNAYSAQLDKATAVLKGA